jgi:DeoR/GlpR family transcriptional regulator of sugar metabolism
VQIGTSSPLSFERRHRILEIVNERSSISVDELAAMFPVSAILITDLLF